VSLPARILAIAITLAILVGFVWWRMQSRLNAIQDFESCAAAGYAVMESFPRQCRTPDGRMFVEGVTP
jgi:hypothetical protein